MKKIYLSRNLKDEIQFTSKNSDKLTVIAFASIYEEIRWMFLNRAKESFTAVITSPVLWFVNVKKTLNMCATTSFDNKVSVDIGADDIYITEAKTDSPKHVRLVITFSPLDGREYDEVFRYPEEKQKELEIE